MEKIVARKRGFTLIELIIVIAIIAIIVAAVFVAMDPVKRLNTARNSTRRTDATAIAQALNLYVTDTLAAGNTVNAAVSAISSSYVMLGTGDGTDCPAITVISQGCGADGSIDTFVAVATDCVDLGPGILVPNYIRAIPIDPSGTYDADRTGYAVKYENGSYSVLACNPESEGPGGGADGEPYIEISR